MRPPAPEAPDAPPTPDAPPKPEETSIPGVDPHPGRQTGAIASEMPVSSVVGMNLEVMGIAFLFSGLRREGNAG
jgi:hypothetical protein